MINPLTFGYNAKTVPKDTVDPDLVPFDFRNSQYIYYCPIDTKFYQTIRQISIAHKLAVTTLNNRYTHNLKGYKRFLVSNIPLAEFKTLDIVRLRFKRNKIGNKTWGNSSQ
jgi:hypothetical protein